MGVRKRNVASAEVFCKVWQTSSNLEEVAERLDTSKINVYQRGKRYRSRGVNLKPLFSASSGDTAGRRKVDVDFLNELIGELK
mgnify:CR=1 FL=1|jgi:transposase